MKKNRKNISRKGKGGLIEHAAMGGALGFGASLVLLFIFAALMLGGLLSESLTDSLILVSVLLGAAVGGFVCAGKEGGRVVIAGLCAGGFYVALILLGTLLFRKQGAETILSLKASVASVAGSCFGAVLKLNKKRKKSSLRRRI